MRRWRFNGHGALNVPRDVLPGSSAIDTRYERDSWA